MFIEVNGWLAFYKIAPLKDLIAIITGLMVHLHSFVSNSKHEIDIFSITQPMVNTTHVPELTFYTKPVIRLRHNTEMEAMIYHIGKSIPEQRFPVKTTENMKGIFV